MSNAERILRRWFDEVWNKGREQTVDELFAAGGIAHGLGEGESTKGPEAFKVFLRNIRSAIPDVQIEVEDIVASDDRAVARVRLTGTHRGEGLGVPPTGRRVGVHGFAMARVAHGQIAEGWNSWDQLGLLKQIGAFPGAPKEDRFLAARP